RLQGDWSSDVCSSDLDVPAGVCCVLSAGRSGALAMRLARSAGVEVPDSPESLALTPVNDGGRRLLLAVGSDARGLAYALTELARSEERRVGEEGRTRW